MTFWIIYFNRIGRTTGTVGLRVLYALRYNHNLLVPHATVVLVLRTIPLALSRNASSLQMSDVVLVPVVYLIYYSSMLQFALFILDEYCTRVADVIHDRALKDMGVKSLLRSWKPDRHKATYF